MKKLHIMKSKFNQIWKNSRYQSN